MTSVNLLASSTSSVPPARLVATTPYRFEFETDQQYETRTGILANESPPAPVPSLTEGTAPANTETTAPPPSADQQSTSFFVFPWWTIVIAFLILVIAAYEYHRRRVARALRKAGLLGHAGTWQHRPREMAPSSRANEEPAATPKESATAPASGTPLSGSRTAPVGLVTPDASSFESPENLATPSDQESHVHPQRAGLFDAEHATMEAAHQSHEAESQAVSERLVEPVFTRRSLVDKPPLKPQLPTVIPSTPNRRQPLPSPLATAPKRKRSRTASARTVSKRKRTPRETQRMR